MSWYRSRQKSILIVSGSYCFKLALGVWRSGSLKVTLAASAHNLAFCFWRSVPLPSSAIWRPRAQNRRGDLVVGQRLHPLFSPESRLDDRARSSPSSSPVGLAGLELRHDLGGEKFERLADVFMFVAPALLDEGDLVDAAGLEFGEVLAQLSGVAMPPSAPARRQLVSGFLEISQMSVRPGLGLPKPSDRQREPEEAEIVLETLARHLSS